MYLTNIPKSTKHELVKILTENWGKGVKKVRSDLVLEHYTLRLGITPVSLQLLSVNLFLGYTLYYCHVTAGRIVAPDNAYINLHVRT